MDFDRAETDKNHQHTRRFFIVNLKDRRYKLMKAWTKFWTRTIPSQERLDNGTLIFGLVWTAICLAGLVVSLKHTDFASAFSSSGSTLLKAGLLYFAFFVGKNFGNLYDKWWANYVTVFVGVAILTFLSWATYGTHMEDADPMFGGGHEVVDFEPTNEQRSSHAAIIFLTLLIPAWLGVYKGQVNLDQPPKSKKLFEYDPRELDICMLSQLQASLTAKLILVNNEMGARYEAVITLDQDNPKTVNARTVLKEGIQHLNEFNIYLDSKLARIEGSMASKGEGKVST